MNLEPFPPTNGNIFKDVSIDADKLIALHSPYNVHLAEITHISIPMSNFQ